MGASGNLSRISLKDYSFEKIKEIMLEELLQCSPNYSDPNNICEKYYFIVSRMNNINDFLEIFRSKIVYYCPDERWAGEIMPQVIGDFLILYDTDQQMDYQNLPTECLRQIITSREEIWT